MAGHRGAFVAAAVACAAVKEDAFLLLCAVSVTLALIGRKSMTRADRAVYLIAPPILALFNLGIYYGYLVPRLSSSGVPFYANYWGSYGASPSQSIIGMLSAPGRVLVRTFSSGFFTTVLMPHLYLPLAAWRWTLGIVPIVLLYGASDNEQLRSYGIYYAIVLVPFLVIGAAAGALAVTGRCNKPDSRSETVTAAPIVVGALLAGITNAGWLGLGRRDRSGARHRLSRRRGARAERALSARRLWSGLTRRRTRCQSGQCGTSSWPG
jgi:uncharacterized membrane protein